MAFEKHPPHIRRKIALICTAVIAVVLVGVLIFVYTSPRRRPAGVETTRLQDFYETISNSTQSSFEEN